MDVGNGYEMKSLTLIPWFGWILIFSALFLQSVLVFRDAQKRGENKWLWGFLCLLNVPTYGILYWFITRKVWRRKRTRKQRGT